LPDRIFSFFLAFFYFWNNAPSSEEYMNLLLDVLHTSREEFYGNLMLAVRRAILSHQYQAQPECLLIYHGVNVPEYASLSSNDLSLIRMSIYVFGDSALDYVV
jgi:hypothetical protein